MNRKLQSAAKNLSAARIRCYNAVQEAYPVGTLVSCKIRGGDPGVRIDARVLRHMNYALDPFEVVVENLQTRKTRRVCVRPGAWHDVRKISR